MLLKTTSQGRLKVATKPIKPTATAVATATAAASAPAKSLKKTFFSYFFHIFFLTFYIKKGLFLPIDIQPFLVIY